LSKNRNRRGNHNTWKNNKKSKSGSITQDSNVITTGVKREELSTSEMKDRVIKLLNYPKEFAKKIKSTLQIHSLHATRGDESNRPRKNPKFA